MVNPYRRGLGLGGRGEPMPYTGGGSARPLEPTRGGRGVELSSGGAVPMPDRGGGGYAEEMPYEGGGSADELAPEEIDPQSKGTYGDGWTDLQRSFRDEVESADDGLDSHRDMNEWQDKWLRRAKELGLGWEEAWQVLDSIADLDPPDEGYGDEAWPE